LAIIRDGDLETGGREIEIAASLDPNNSIVRSYLGKTYFEEKKTGLDEREYAIAKELDPNDPTPWFYDAIAKQTTNRPVEALQNLEKARELNDNRAVYRSRLMLDSDEAARSASIARIYTDLGFEKRALVEGWDAVNTDPTNFSAHRFLADSYSVLKRHEIARVSELLQSQLLQPINIAPIQPRLGESDLFLISSQGPGNTSFSEFNPIFNRNRLALQGSGLLGGNDTEGGEGVVSGIYKNFSFSGGYTYFDTDGWRKNADQTDKIGNIFAQYAFTPNTSIQAEYRYRDVETGDISQVFFEDDFARNQDDKRNIKSGRFGFKHSFSPGSDLIGNFSYQDADLDFFYKGFVNPGLVGLPPPDIEDNFKLDEDTDSYSGEISYLFRSHFFNVVTGGGYFYIDDKVKVNEEFVWPGIDPPLLIAEAEDKVETDIDHYNVYLYSTIIPLKNLKFTVGASGDFFDVDDKDVDQRDFDRNKFNPKLGVIWNPFVGTTLRGAVFKTFKRTLTTNQTLEPTQVAGFNQFFDDLTATEAWNYGVAVDQKFTQKLYGGAEYTYRDLDIPFITDDPKVDEINWDEKLARAYLYYTPHEWVALRAEYRYEDVERDEENAFGIKEVKTHSVPLGLNFFHPSGISAGFQATYYDQDGEFQRQADPFLGDFEDGDDNFWLVDAAIGYRLPKRYGFITLGATNLFDENFEYAETDINNPRIQPDRTFFVKITLALP
jgi:opacity protein-like surface antigen/tetratricopeptide (TPR) repeat protein